MAKKGKKKGKKTRPMDPEEEKKELVRALMAKCNMTEEEVLEAYDGFHEQNKKGVISKEEFIHSRKVIKNQIHLNLIRNKKTKTF